MKKYIRFNLEIFIAVVTLLVGFITKNNLFLVSTILIASLVDLFTRNWVISDRIGSNRLLNYNLKFVFGLFGIYSIIGVFINIFLLIIWII